MNKFHSLIAYSLPINVGKLVVAYRWSAVYSTEPWPTVCIEFSCPQNYSSWYDLYSVEVT